MPILTPKTTLNIIRAQQTQQNAEQRVLLVGQKTASGTASAGLNQDIPDSEATINGLFGAKSHLASMCRKFKSINKATALDVIVLEDAGGATSASGTIAVTGTATEDGTLTFYVMDKVAVQAEVAVSTGDTATAIGDAIETALQALASDQPYTASATTGTVTITAANGGEIFNGAPLAVSGSVAGVSIALTAFASGATNPTLTNVFDPVGNQRYQTVGWPGAYATTELKSFLDARFNDEYRVLDGVGIYCVSDVYANLNGGPSENSQSIVALADNLVDESDRKGPAIQTFNDLKMSVLCAVRALRLTDSASLTGIVTTAAPADQFGGSGISTLPYHNSVMGGLAVPNPQDEFSLTQIADLTGDGYTIASANKAFNTVILGDAVTTYKTTPAGDPDTSFKYLNTVDTSSAIREFYVNNLQAKYAQTRLTGGELVPNRDMANASSIRAFCKSLYNSLAALSITEAGPLAVKDYDENLIIEVSVSDGEVTINQAPLQVGQLRTNIGTIAVKFSS